MFDATRRDTPLHPVLEFGEIINLELALLPLCRLARLAAASDPIPLDVFERIFAKISASFRRLLDSCREAGLVYVVHTQTVMLLMMKYAMSWR